MNNENVIFYVYNQTFTIVGIVEKYISLIWADRYDECGDFELVVDYNETYKNLLQKNYYCNIEYTNHHAIIEKIEITKDEDGNATMTVTGRTLEILLDRRIVISKLEFGMKKDENDQYIKAYLQDALEKIFKKNIIEPKDKDRLIDHFIFNKSEDKKITKIKIQESFDKDSIYDIVTNKCADNHIGFNILLDKDNQFVFSLFKGVDRSNDILFSPYYGNLNNSSYYSSIEDYKNVMIVVENDSENETEESDVPDNYFTVSNLEIMPSGVDRREISETASSLRDNSQSTSTASEEKKKRNLREKAKKKLNVDYKIKTGFEGDIIPGVLYEYLKDYNVGDKIMLEDEYDNTEVVYISEVVITFDENGLTIIPTFKEIDWNEED